MQKSSFLIAAVLASAPLVAHAQPRRPQDVPPPVAVPFGKGLKIGAVNPEGWTLLGEQTVQGKRDRDVITVGSYEGKFDQIQLSVLDSDIELKDLKVTFTNGETWSPTLKFSFKEGQRSKAIDLPGDNRRIAKIELLYGNTPGGGAARVQIFGKDKANNNGRPPAPTTVFTPPPAAQGWKLLGEQTVSGRRDRDVINVGKYEGAFSEIQLAVLDSDADIKDVKITFGNGEVWSPGIRHLFKEGQRTQSIDLPANKRYITKIELLYANTPGGGSARVQVYGHDRSQGNTGIVPPAIFDETGWTKLGEQKVNGKSDKDKIKVGKRKGGFDQLTLVVSDSDLELDNLTVVFADGKKWSPSLKHTFKEGARSHVIDLPGKDRIIQRIELAYHNTPGGGNAKVAVYGRDAGRPAPPPLTLPTWENKGWTRVAASTVDGWRDKDHVNVTVAKPFSELMFVVGGSDIELRNVTVTFGNGEKFEMPSSVVFKEGTRTAPIDLPGSIRKIKSIDMAYANLPGGGRAKLEIWARAKQ